MLERTGSVKSDAKYKTFAKSFQTQEMMCNNKREIKCQTTSKCHDNKLALIY